MSSRSVWVKKKKKKKETWRKLGAIAFRLGPSLACEWGGGSRFSNQLCLPTKVSLEIITLTLPVWAQIF